MISKPQKWGLGWRFEEKGIIWEIVTNPAFPLNGEQRAFVWVEPITLIYGKKMPKQQIRYVDRLPAS